MPGPPVVKSDDGADDPPDSWPAWKQSVWNLFEQDTHDQNLGEVLTAAWDGKLDRVKEAAVPCCSPCNQLQ
jgi:hypothetical protein